MHAQHFSIGAYGVPTRYREAVLTVSKRGLGFFSKAMSSTKVTNPWILTHAVNSQARVNLVCFPYAGGGPQVFNSWQRSLPELQVCMVQYPGRGSRIHESAFTNCTELVDAFMPHLFPFVNKPFAFFGHSMGAIIAFEVARRLQKRGLKPARLFLSGRRAPQIPARERPTYDLPDAEFTAELRRLNGIPTEAWDHPELMQLMLQIIRADFTVAQTYTYQPGPRLNFPFSVFGGLQDVDVTSHDLEAWCELTNCGCSLRMFDGDHFFIQTAPAAVLKRIAEQLIAVP